MYSHGDESRWLSPQQTQAQRRWSVWSPARAASASLAPPWWWWGWARDDKRVWAYVYAVEGQLDTWARGCDAPVQAKEWRCGPGERAAQPPPSDPPATTSPERRKGRSRGLFQLKLSGRGRNIWKRKVDWLVKLINTFLSLKRYLCVL